MKPYEELSRLDRAFTQAPPELAASVEAAFVRGEMAVKQRHKILTAVSVAAVLAVMFAALALAAGQLVKPHVDRVVAAQGSGEGKGTGKGTPVETATATPEPTANPTPEPTVEPILEVEVNGEVATVEDGTFPAELATAFDDAFPAELAEPPLYYATQQGQYFHADATCMGMWNALPLSLNAAWASGKLPCPTCIDAAELPAATYYATREGQYYHVVADCMGMRNAEVYTLSDAVGEGKTPCPKCLPAVPTYCWATPFGVYYHSDRDCQGMRDARVYTEVYAKHLGKQPCPECWTDNASIAW